MGPRQERGQEARSRIGPDRGPETGGPQASVPTPGRQNRPWRVRQKGRGTIGPIGTGPQRQRGVAAQEKNTMVRRSEPAGLEASAWPPARSPAARKPMGVFLDLRDGYLMSTARSHWSHRAQTRLGGVEKRGSRGTESSSSQISGPSSGPRTVVARAVDGPIGTERHTRGTTRATLPKWTSFAPSGCSWTRTISST